MADAHVWLVHTPIEIAVSVEKGSVVAIGWEQMGDLSTFGTREEIRQKYQSVYSETGVKAGIGTGQLHRFAHEIKKGDIVLTPLKVSREVLIGEVISEYVYDPQTVSANYPNVHRVKWLKKVSRDELSVPFRNAIGGIMTVFNVDAYSGEVNKLLGREVVKVETAIEVEPEIPTTFIYEDIKQKAEQMVLDFLSQVDAFDFQKLVAGLLRAMGFQIIRVSSPGPDGGFDIDASPDIFGFESPRVKVQVKNRRSQAAGPEVQQLAGVTGATHKLFVSTSGFNSAALREAEKHSNLALIDGDRLVRLLLEYYEKLDHESQALVPLRKIYILAKSTV